MNVQWESLISIVLHVPLLWLGERGRRERERASGRMRERGMKEAEVLAQHCAKGRRRRREEKGGERCLLCMFRDE